MCKIKLLKKDKQVTTAWSGGSTTQLAIYPETSKYSERNFAWRVSTAVIESEESSFTQLMGYRRQIMILEGSLKLLHIDHHESVLGPYDKDIFEGSWVSNSFGKATDFNLMMSVGWEGSIDAYNFIPEENLKILNQSDKNNFCGVYCYSGSVNLKLGEEEQERLDEKDFAMIELNGEDRLEIFGDSRATLIIVKIGNN